MVRRYLGDVSMTGSGSGTSNVTSVPNSDATTTAGEEIPVKRHKPSYGLQDTHTCVLPLKVHFCGKKLNQRSIQFVIKTNSIYDSLKTTLQSIPTSGTLNDKTFYSGLWKNSGDGVTFSDCYKPNSGIDGGDNQNAGIEHMYWRNYFAKFYKNYHVVGCDVNLTIQNLGDVPLQVGMLTYSDETEPPSELVQGGDAGININVFDAWKHTKRIYIPACNSTYASTTKKITDFEKGRKTLHEQISPGDAPKEGRELHKVTNGQVQSEVWTATGSSPSHMEYLGIYMWTDILTEEESWKFNCELNLKYIVQFRDLKKSFEYITGQGSNYPMPGEYDGMPTMADIVQFNV